LVLTSRKFSFFFYLFLTALFFIAIAFLPRFFQGKNFKTSFSVESELKKFPLEDILQETETGKSTTLTQWFEKVGADSILLNFWATWCPPCIEELSSFEFLKRQLDKNPSLKIRVLAVSVDEDKSKVGKLFGTLDFKVTLPWLWDPRGNLAKKVGTTKFPETYWINKRGEVLYKWIGPQDWTSQEILSALQLSVASQPER
jgi:thiol-disulfide isomerase/thioredoxin